MTKSEASSGFADISVGDGPTPPGTPRGLMPLPGTDPPPPPADPAAGALLARYKLTVLGKEATTGERTYTVNGDTYPCRDGLRDLGGRWNGLRQRWEFTGEDPTAAIAAWLADHGAAAQSRYIAERTPRSPGLADVGLAHLAKPDADTPEAVPPAPDKPPHYWGHRARLRDRLLAGDDEALPDYELLELLLFYTVRIQDTKPLAKELLDEFGSLSRLVNADLDRFEKFAERTRERELPAVDQKTVALFRTLRALAARLAREEVPVGTELTNWDKLIAYLRASMGHRPVEQFRLLFLDRRNVLIADEKQNEGSIDHTPVYPREVVKRALALDASALIMVHNHPSNHPQPSRGDIDMTQLVQKALKAVGVVLHDHVIISRKGHSSFKQMGLL